MIFGFKCTPVGYLKTLSIENYATDGLIPNLSDSFDKSRTGVSPVSVAIP
jgi:hypothetical protein